MYRGALTDDDLEFLNARSSPWRLMQNALRPNEIPIQHGDVLVIDNFGLPQRFQPSMASMLLVIMPYYPATPLDMFYLDQAIARLDGRPLSCVQPFTIQGKQWWRWSRHWEPQSWRVGYDGIASHCDRVRSALQSDSA